MSRNIKVIVNKDNNIQADRARAEAAAQQAEDAVVSPLRAISVFSNAPDAAPFFTTIAGALAYANTLTPTFANPVYIRSFIPSSFGVDLYANFDLGIVIESAFDYFKNFLNMGGDLNLSLCLYDIDLSRIKFDIKL